MTPLSDAERLEVLESQMEELYKRVQDLETPAFCKTRSWDAVEDMLEGTVSDWMDAIRPVSRVNDFVGMPKANKITDDSVIEQVEIWSSANGYEVVADYGDDGEELHARTTLHATAYDLAKHLARKYRCPLIDYTWESL